VTPSTTSACIPRRTIPSCSCSWLWSGTVAPGSNSIRLSIAPSPNKGRPLTPDASSNARRSSKLTNCGSPADTRPLSPFAGDKLHADARCPDQRALVADAFQGEGFTVCIDPIWGEPLARVLAMAARHARVVHVGRSAGPEAPLRSADVRGKELTILEHSNFAMTTEDRNRAYLELLEHLVAGRIALDLLRYPLDAVADAFERQAAGPGGKVVVEL
jgi:Zinc-binding dehydrogenase